MALLAFVVLEMPGCAAAPRVIRGSAAPRGPRAVTLRPRFAWPAPLELELSRSSRRAQTLNGQARRTQAPQARWRWRFVREEASGLLQAFTAEGAFAGAMAIGPGGEVIRPQGSLRVGPPMLLHLWALMVTLWSGRAMELGQAYRLRPAATTEAPAPSVQLTARKAGPCPELPERRCVWLEALQKPDAEGLRALGDETMRGFIEAVRDALPEAGEAELEIASVQAERHSELVAEVETLVPHALVERSYLRVVVRKGADGARNVSEVVEETRWAFVRLDPD